MSKTVASFLLRGPPSKCPPLRRSLGQHILDCLKQNEANTYQIDPQIQKTDTRGEVRLRSIRTALEMQKRGLTRDDFIMICAKNHNDMPLPLLGGLYLGVVTSPVHALFTNVELKRMLSLMSPKLIFCDAEFEAKFQQLLAELNMQLNMVVFERDFAPFVAPQPGEDTFEAAPVDVEEQLALVLCSSGTTGTMKGIPHTHNTLMHAVYDTEFVASRGDRMLTFSPLCWNSAPWLLIYCAAFGNIRIATEFTTPEAALKIIQDYKVNHFNSSPPKLFSLIRSPDFAKYDLSSLNNIWSRGTASTAEQMQTFRAHFKDAFVLNAVGMTEICMMIAAFDPRTEKDINIAKVKSHGRLVPGMEAKVVDLVTNEPVGRNQEGELCFKSKSLMTGYYMNAEATAGSFDADGWFRTGDLVYFDEDDCLFIVGRLKEILKYQVWTIMPSELEYLLDLHPEVQSSCVVGIPHEIDGDLPVAFVVRRPGGTVTEEELVKYVNDQVNTHQQLRGGVRFLQAMPMTGTGKVRRMELQKMAKDLKAPV